MRKIYFNIFFSIIILLWIVYFVQSYTQYEGFTPQIHGLYRPYVRKFNQHYEYFINQYGPQIIFNKLRKWNIY